MVFDHYLKYKVFYEDDSLNGEEKMAETSGYRNKKRFSLKIPNHNHL